MRDLYGLTARRYRLGIAVLIGAAMLSPALAEPRFVETFDDDPVAAGRFMLHDNPGDAARFTHNSADGTLTAHYDTGQPTARLVHPLGATLSDDDSFTLRVEFVIDNDGFFAHSEKNAQIAFGLMNLMTTGQDRVFGVQGGGAFDLLSFDYFPNITIHGGPSVGPTIINSDTGIGLAGAINFSFGSETESDPEDTGVPRDVPLVAVVRYDAEVSLAVLRLFQEGTPLAINVVGASFLPGGLDGDPTTIVSSHYGSGFVVDAFGLMLWRDFDSSGSSVIADVHFDSVEVCWSGFADFDGDCDVDDDDYQVLDGCTSGPNVPRTAGCDIADFDGDGDVDQEDFGAFQVRLTGPR